ncbi:MAG: oxidoreductase [Mycobacterium sp.]|uniref:oxidoreductase n=1 Tax=Mycobacterium sp. TaxID=1785 RepID=UPI003C51A9CA
MDLHGRTFVITGANSGLGAVTARALAGAGGQVIMACRDVEKANTVAADIGTSAQVRHLDLGDLTSVREFAASLGEVDTLINNAGVMAVPKRYTIDGFESQIGINHLGHFALTGLLIERIRDRVVTMSSGLHVLGSIDLHDLNWEQRRYRRMGAYGASKLANLLFAYELQRRLTLAGSRVLSVAAHPGYAATNLQGHTESFLDPIMLFTKGFAQSAQMGALSEICAATGPVEPGGYYGPKRLRGYPRRVQSGAKSRDPEMAARLWELSEKLTGVNYPNLRSLT